ncbi:hypothetical protein COOONC_13752, partial [Cooperia oncophora]
MNALTSKTSPNIIDADVTVSGLLASLIKMKNGNCFNVMNGMPASASQERAQAALNLTPENRHALTNICDIIADWLRCLLSFIRDNVEQKLISDQRCEVMFDRAVSPVHTIRVSTVSAE